jgi:hypothetical protein
MNNSANAGLVPSRILYPMIRISDLERSLTFYIEALGIYGTCARLSNMV